MIKIRRAEKTDYETVWNLDKMWYGERISPHRSPPVSLREYKSVCKDAIIFVAEDENDIVGFVMARKKVAKTSSVAHAVKKGDCYLDLDGVYVLKKYRGKRIGLKLVKCVLEESLASGIVKVRFVADAKNQDALLNFYYKLGAKRMWTKMRFDLNG